MKDLITKLAAATKPDRDLDADIYALIARRDLADSRTDGTDGISKNQFYEAGGDGRGWHYAPEYTASIDAALTLVPEGWTRAVDATTPECLIDVDLFLRGLKVRGVHAIEAIATCIAALIARDAK